MPNRTATQDWNIFCDKRRILRSQKINIRVTKLVGDLESCFSAFTSVDLIIHLKAPTFPCGLFFSPVAH